VVHKEEVLRCVSTTRQPPVVGNVAFDQKNAPFTTLDSQSPQVNDLSNTSLVLEKNPSLFSVGGLCL
jgi:hypothetical protein